MPLPQGTFQTLSETVLAWPLTCKSSCRIGVMSVKRYSSLRVVGMRCVLKAVMQSILISSILHGHAHCWIIAGQRHAFGEQLLTF